MADGLKSKEDGLTSMADGLKSKEDRLKPVLLETMNNFNDMAILNGETEAANDGSVAPLDGAAHAALNAAGAKAAVGIDGKRAAATAQEALAKMALGPNN